jgi:hypothetical protein
MGGYGRLWEAMGGVGGHPPNFFYFTFIIEYFGGWPCVLKRGFLAQPPLTSLKIANLKKKS